MNYSKIYDDFIADRRKKESQLIESGAYRERHHILPRCLGGNDEPENLIALTPEDHLFAHLLLAKIHGGKLWAAVYAMCHLANSNTKHRRRFADRTRFGHVRRALAGYYREMLSGPDGPIADKTVHTLHHFDGRKVSGNRFELEALTGVTRQQISAVLRGAKMNAKGWYSKRHNPEGRTREELISLSLRSDEVLTLYHHDGRVWTGTKSDFRSEFGRKFYIQTEGGDCAGWHLTAQDAAGYRKKIERKARRAAGARGDISGSNNPNADRKIYTFRNSVTGEVVKATRTEMVSLYGVTKNAIGGVVTGTQMSAGEWELEGSVRRRTKAGTVWTFEHLSGAVFKGTRAEMAEHIGKTKGTVLRMVNHGATSSCGWRLSA